MRGALPRGTLTPTLSRRRGDGGPEMQPEREIRSHKGREMQGNESKIAFISFICFSESGLFKGLRRIQTKKSSSHPTRAGGCDRSISKAFRRSISPLPDPPAAPEFGGSEDL